MTLRSVSPHRLDIELVVIESSPLNCGTMTTLLPPGYLIREAVGKSWKWVIEEDVSDDSLRILPDAVCKFVNGLSELVPRIGAGHSFIRVGVFFETATCTVVIPGAVMGHLATLGVGLITTAYPCQGD